MTRPAAFSFENILEECLNVPIIINGREICFASSSATDQNKIYGIMNKKSFLLLTFKNIFDRLAQFMIWNSDIGQRLSFNQARSTMQAGKMYILYHFLAYNITFHFLHHF